MDRIQQARAQAMSRFEQARARVRGLAPGGAGATSGTILDNVRAAVDSGGILGQFRQRIRSRQPILGPPPAPPAMFGSSAVSSFRDATTPGTGVVVKKIIV